MHAHAVTFAVLALSSASPVLCAPVHQERGLTELGVAAKALGNAALQFGKEVLPAAGDGFVRAKNAVGGAVQKGVKAVQKLPTAALDEELARGVGASNKAINQVAKEGLASKASVEAIERLRALRAPLSEKLLAAEALTPQEANAIRRLINQGDKVMKAEVQAAAAKAAGENKALAKQLNSLTRTSWKKPVAYTIGAAAVVGGTGFILVNILGPKIGASSEPLTTEQVAKVAEYVQTTPLSEAELQGLQQDLANRGVSQEEIASIMSTAKPAAAPAVQTAQTQSFDDSELEALD